LCQAANYLCGFPRERSLTQGQALQNPASRATSVKQTKPFILNKDIKYIQTHPCFSTR
jgi:hypothetical protein